MEKTKQRRRRKKRTAAALQGYGLGSATSAAQDTGIRSFR